MTFFRCIILMQFTTVLALGQVVQSSKVPAPAAAVVRSLYHEVIARHPSGIPKGADMKAFAPYLSEGLTRRIDSALACENDYYRGHQNPNEKPEIEWLEFGLFSGANEKALPVAFYLESTQQEKDGSFHIPVKLRYGDRLNWQVATIVVRETGHYVIDDIVFLKDETLNVESRLSEILTIGCNGPKWVGNGEHGMVKN